MSEREGDSQLLGFLRDETGDTLRSVLQYYDSSYRVLYSRHSNGNVLGRPVDEIEEVITEFRDEARVNHRREVLLDVGQLQCSLHFFDNAVVLHFTQGQDTGLLCAYDPEAATNLSTFVQLCQPYIEQHAKADDNIDDPVLSGAEPAP